MLGCPRCRSMLPSAAAAMGWMARYVVVVGGGVQPRPRLHTVSYFYLPMCATPERASCAAVVPVGCSCGRVCGSRCCRVHAISFVPLWLLHCTHCRCLCAREVGHGRWPPPPPPTRLCICRRRGACTLHPPRAVAQACARWQPAWPSSSHPREPPLAPLNPFPSRLSLGALGVNWHRLDVGKGVGRGGNGRDGPLMGSVEPTGRP